MAPINKKKIKYKSTFHAAEIISNDLSLLRGKKQPAFFDESEIRGLLSVEEIQKEVHQLKKIDVDSYIQRVVSPSESKKDLVLPKLLNSWVEKSS